MLRQVITRTGTVWTQDFPNTVYDGMNRLTYAQETSGAGSWVQSFGYDRYGNWWLDVNSGLPAPNNETPRNAAWYLADNRLAGWGYGDGRGNITSILNMSRNFTYDAENRQVTSTINGAPSIYTYDGEGRRIRKVSGITSTLYVYDAFGKLAAEYANQTPASGTRYIHVDHLGSTRLVTDANGTPITAGCHDYLPFGQEIVAGVNGRGSCFPSAPSAGIEFTGKERDGETGLDFFGARYYSGPQGRFTGPDPSPNGMAIGDPQSWNLYSYVRNRPTAFVDVGGKWATRIHGDILSVALDGYASVGAIKAMYQRAQRLDRDFSAGGSYMHALRDPSDSPERGSQRIWQHIADKLSEARAGVGGDGAFNGTGLVAFAEAVHAVQDWTSPSHTTASGQTNVWRGFSGENVRMFAHGFAENSPSDSWARFGLAVRLTMAAFLQANPAAASRTGLTSENIDAKATKRITDYVDRYYRQPGGILGFSPGLEMRREAARQCALGNPAACME